MYCRMSELTDRFNAHLKRQVAYGDYLSLCKEGESAVR